MESAPVIFPTVRNSPSPGLHRLTIFLAAIFYILSFHFPQSSSSQSFEKIFYSASYIINAWTDRAAYNNE